MQQVSSIQKKQTTLPARSRHCRSHFLLLQSPARDFTSAIARSCWHLEALARAQDRARLAVLARARSVALAR
jgi:hypothetical protein